MRPYKTKENGHKSRRKLSIQRTTSSLLTRMICPGGRGRRKEELLRSAYAYTMHSVCVVMLTTVCRSSTPGTSSGSPESRVTSVRDRLNIIRQCVLRNEHFAPSTLPSRDREKLVTVGVIVCLARVWLADGRYS